MIGFPIEHPSFEWVFLWSVVHILFVVWLVFLWTSFLWIGLSMISSSYIWSWHIWFSYDQPFLYLRSYVCVPIFIHGINGLPISVHRIIGFLMNGLPIIAFLYLRSYDCVFLYPCLPVERGGSLPGVFGSPYHKMGSWHLSKLEWNRKKIVVFWFLVEKGQCCSHLHQITLFPPS